MSSLADLPELVGFFSYSREDDEDSHGALSALRERMQRELRGQLGRSMKTFRLWQDKEAIAAGKLWEAEIKAAVGQAVFFIPIVTPTAVRSPFCRFEFDAFLAREAELGRDDLVFPILYIKVPELEDDARLKSDPVLSVIAKRQYLDWREFRHRDVLSTDVKAAVERFCGQISDALHRPQLTPEEREIETQRVAATRPTIDVEPKRRAAPQTDEVATKRSAFISTVRRILAGGRLKLFLALLTLIVLVAGGYVLSQGLHVGSVPREASTAAPMQPVPLPKLLNQATVLVVTKGGFGSGFFVTPQLVLTNRHVVEGSEGTLFVGNRELGRMMAVDEVAMSESADVTQPDYALLKLRNGESRFFLSVSLDLPAQLQNVTAAGFPRDPAILSKLTEFDIPDLALTSGAVVVIQSREGPTPLILHRASISPLTSGGPLVDECGRVVGINTFVSVSDRGGDVMNYALASVSAVQFLKQQGVTPKIALAPCVASPATATSRSP
jgi:S1-C subfamily serine protease